jgi:histidinol-phosphate aminotransferase
MPKPGILDIHAYVPGKAKVEGVADPVKLSANENILGCSEAAEAYRDAAEAAHLSRQPHRHPARRHRRPLPPGARAADLRRRLRRGLRPAQPGLPRARRQHRPGRVRLRRLRHRRPRLPGRGPLRPEPNYRIDVDEVLKAGRRAHPPGVHRQPRQPDRHLDPVLRGPRLHAALPPSVVLVLDGAYAEFAPTRLRRRPGPGPAAENVVVTRTFSKLHGLAALRVGWGYGRRRSSRPSTASACRSTPRSPASTRRSPPWPTWSSRSARSPTSSSGGPGWPSSWAAWAWRWWGRRRPTSCWSASQDAGQDGAEAEAFLSAEGLLVRAVGNYGLPDHLRITIGLEEHNRAP